MNNFFSKIKNHKAQNLPFVLYSKPNSNRIIGLLQQNNDLHTVSNFTEKGFVFASFDEKQLILIPENESEIITSEQENIAIVLSDINDSGFDAAAKKQYEDLVAKGIEAIKNDEFKKVDLSRSESVALAEFDFTVVFQQLIY